MVEVTVYEGTISSSIGEWFRILPNVFSGCPVSLVHIYQHLSFLCTWEKRWCAPPVVMYMLITDDIIYQGLSLVENRRIIARVEIGIIIFYVV